MDMHLGQRAASEAGLNALDLPTLKTMLDASVDSILVIDERGLIQAYNQAVVRNFGFHGDELIGENIAKLMPRPHATSHDGYLENYRRSGERKIIGIGREVTGRRKDGTIFPLHLSVGEFTARGMRYFFGICHDITERQQLNDRLVEMATTDHLTGCLNRQHLVFAMNEIASHEPSLAVLFLDLNGFKEVNDNYGHRVGDAMLAQVGKRLSALVGERNLLGRVGGDEFVACLAGIRNADEAICAARLLETAFESPFMIDGLVLKIGASVGISLYPEHGDTADDLINQADLAMYYIKEVAREGAGTSHPWVNTVRYARIDERVGEDRTVQVFDRRLRNTVQARHELLTRLRGGVARGELELHYQPQFDIRTLQPCGLEALLRWRDGARLVSPNEFLPLARKHGLMLDISRWVIDRACRDAVGMAREIMDVPVAVNVSAQSINDRGFSDLVARSLTESGLPAGRLELEITEDVAMDVSPQAMRNAAKITEMGIHLVMDDYGIGFSSLKHLKTLRFSKLKIDRSFIASLPTSSDDQTVVKTTVQLGHGMDMAVVAEGVETTAQLEFLKQLGCEIGQGYLYARPMPKDELLAWFRRPRQA